MTLYYLLVFILLIAEILAFVILILPFPRAWRRAVLRWVSKSDLVARSQIVIKFTFIAVLILFIDAANRSFSQEKIEINDPRSEVAHHAKKFYNQRNMYLTGFTLFLSLILNRTYVLVVELLAAEDELESIKKQMTNQSKEQLRFEEIEGRMKQDIENLQKELEDKDRDFGILKKQANQQASEYNRIADELNNLERQGSSESKKDS